MQPACPNLSFKFCQTCVYSSLSGNHQTSTCMYWLSEPLKQHKRIISHRRVTQNKGKHGFPISWNTALTDFMISNLPPESSSQCRPAFQWIFQLCKDLWVNSPWHPDCSLSHPTAFFSKVLIRSANQDKRNFGVGKNTQKPHKVRKKDTRWHSAPEDSCSFYFSCYLFAPLCFPLFPLSKEMWEVV